VFAGSSVSIKNILHLGQQVRSKSFVEFDQDHGVKRHSSSIGGMIADKIDGVLETVSAIELRNVRAADITNWGQKATAELESIGTDITNWGQKASAEILESISTEFTDWGSKMFKTVTYPFSGN